ncbi:MAG: hypothetical protein ACD_3C00018G0002 [uncultured bacterium (gcode 4)]|uniref:Uncharacterized protein n=1 Tax=uncultured bacterium (gcode 4) TaxID=1234023 RepID=K2G0I7_9BACT|nr:MAG: hypothetical protein ACD_3C00018G0002 [uncultured bacterium (gcode 4)]
MKKLKNMENLDKINDILQPKEWNKDIIVDVAQFFPQVMLNAIRLNQSNLFSDLYQELEKKIDLRRRKILKVRKFTKDDFKDIIKRRRSQSPFWAILYRKKQRTLQDPIGIIQPLPKSIRNTLDVRTLEISQNLKTYPDIYILPLLPNQKIKKLYKKNIITIRLSAWKWTKIWSLAAVVFLALGLFALWYKNYIQAEVTKWYQWIYALKWIKDADSLKNSAKDLRTKFRILQLMFWPINMLWNNFIYTNESVKLASNIIDWWAEISNIALIGGSIWKDFNTEKEASKTPKGEWIKWISNVKITEFFKQEFNNLENLDKSLKKTITYFSQVETLWNPALDNKFQSTLESLIKSDKYIDFVLKNKDMLLKLAWDAKPMRYFILNQNKDEIRANWWFPGSVITLEVYKWTILKYDKKDIYYYDWHLSPYRETPPEWLNIISPNHWLRDANYSPVFLDSVKKINFFYEKAWGSTLDTVIAINQWLIEELLKKYWSVHMDEIGTDITADNFSLIMSTLVENKFQKVDSPKDILFKFTDKLEKKLIEKRDFMWYIDMFLNNILAWEIALASRDTEIQKYFDSLWIFENWKTDTWNWIYPVFTSISWNKSDRYMKRDFTLRTANKWNCEISNSFALTSKNTYDANTQNSIRQVFDELKITDTEERDRLIAIQWAAENRQFVRVLTPKWSILGNTYWNNINADDSNPNYTFFKFYAKTDVWQVWTIKFDYTTKPKSCQDKAIFYKQPWLSDYTFNQGQ